MKSRGKVLLDVPSVRDCSSARELAEAALQANKDHQYALKVYTERLQAELDAVDKLIVSTPSLYFLCSINE